jgi:hypothetical protein
MMKTTLTCAALVLLLELAGQCRAGITVYTSAPAFDAATSGLTNIDFNGIAAPGKFVYYGSGPLSLSGVTFTSNDSSAMYVIDPGYYGSSYPGGGFLSAAYSTTKTDIITAALPGPTTALAMNYGGLLGGPVTFMFKLSDGSTFDATTSLSIAGGSLDFIGVTDTTALSSVAISMPDSPNYYAIDNFQFGTALSIPEPRSVVSASVATLLVSGAMYRRRKRKAA